MIHILRNFALCAVFGELLLLDQAFAYTKKPKVLCYLGFWTRYISFPMSYNPTFVPAKLCDVLVYAFVSVNSSSFEIMHRDYNADISEGGFRQSVRLKTTNPKLKVILSVGGQPYEGVGEVRHYSEMMRDFSRRKIFIDSSLKFLQDFGFDGLELQWYYPGSKAGLPEDKDNFLDLVKELRRCFGTNYTLMATVPFLRSDIESGFHVSELIKYVDYFNVRTIEMNVYDRQHVDNSSPLKRRSFDEHSEENVESVLNIYSSMGAPKKKLIFGIPFENHVFILEDIRKDGLKAPAVSRDAARGTFSGLPGVLFYHEVCANIQSGKWIAKRDEPSGIPYAVNNKTKQWVSFEDEETLTQKVQFARKEGYAGVFVWLMENDDFRGLCGEKHALLNTIRRVANSP